ncbi:MAG: hypothetical protein ACLUMK_07550 [Christensenellales bacterium]
MTEGVKAYDGKQLKKKILDSGRTLLFSNEDLKRLIIHGHRSGACTVGMADTMMISSVGEAAISACRWWI